ncbi:MAG TPA: hypothetical protein VKW78_09125 [Terriglobales bacterium]|nr:hypothetical protein [Terriglobales bacterium]
MESMKAQPPEMTEGPEAMARLREAMTAMLTVPKSAMPASPFKKWVPKKKRRAKRKRQAH